MAVTTLVYDTETDGLLDEMTRLWTIQIGDADGDDATVYADQPGFPPIAEALARLRAADVLVAHNATFDWAVLDRFHPGVAPWSKHRDTLVMARLLDPEQRTNTLRYWGEKLGVAKGEYVGDFQRFDEDLVRYALQDVAVLRALWLYLSPRLEGWGESVDLEHRVAHAMFLQERNGFRLDVAAARKLEGDLRAELETIERELQPVFPPIWVPLPVPPAERFRADWKGSWAPKDNNRKMGYTAGCPLTKVQLQLFNPSSRAQAAERLTRLGWKPRVFGADGAPTLDEETLAGLPWKEAKALVRYFGALKLLGQVSDGKSGWLKLVKPTGRVHGRVNPNGACTGRMSHSHPNMAQVSKDTRARACWIPRDGWTLVGCDAEGLEARMLAHYLARWDGGAFGDRVVNGDSDAGTDVHTMNLKALVAARTLHPKALDKAAPSHNPKHANGFKAGRDIAKRCLYALMYGAGDPKLGNLAKECWRDVGEKPPAAPDGVLGKAVRAALAKAMTGMDLLTKAVQARAKERGYVVGLDGRHIHTRSQHSALNTLLQGGGAIVMKKAIALFADEFAPGNGLVHGRDFALVAAVHDEQQFEATPESAKAVGDLFAACIVEAGVRLGVRCPLAGKASVGATWAVTH